MGKFALEHAGSIKYWNDVKGYGFVKLDSGEEVFFHRICMTSNSTPERGDRVTVDLDEDHPDGPRVTQMMFT